MDALLRGRFDLLRRAEPQNFTAMRTKFSATQRLMPTAGRATIALWKSNILARQRKTTMISDSILGARFSYRENLIRIAVSFSFLWLRNGSAADTTTTQPELFLLRLCDKATSATCSIPTIRSSVRPELPPIRQQASRLQGTSSDHPCLARRALRC